MALLLCASSQGVAGCGPGDAAAGLGAGAGAEAAALAAPCDFSGTWAVALVIPVAWAGNFGVRAGHGELVQQMRSVRRAAPGGVVDELTLCGVSVPDYRGNFAGELYGLRFPEALFDGDGLPATRVFVQLQPAGDASCAAASFASEDAAVTLGVEMGDPRRDLWPARWSDVASVVDADADGHPGVTLQPDVAPGYDLPRTGIVASGGRRAQQIYIAQRNVARTSGRVESCERMVGAAEIPRLGGKLALNSHVVGCTKVNGQPCSRKELDLIGSARPEYSLDGDGRVLMQRVADAASCADIRALPLP